MASSRLEITDKLKFFVKNVVVIYERIQDYYIQRIEDNIQKSNTSAHTFMDIMEIENILPENFDGDSKVLYPIVCDILIKGLYESEVDFNCREIINLINQLHLFEENPNTIRRILVESAYRVFCSFEYQFVQVSKDGSWEKAIIKIAKGFVSAIIKYCSINEDVQFSVESITHGKAEGIKSNSSNKSESSGLDDFFNDNFDKYLIEQSLKFAHTNILEHDDVNKHIKELLSDINKEGPTSGVIIFEQVQDMEENLNDLELCIADNLETLKLFLINKRDGIKKYFHNLLENIDKPIQKNQQVNNKITTFNRMYSRIDQSRPFWFGVMDKLSTFTGRQQQLLCIEEKLKQNIIVVICGLGGVGKSKLALEYIYRHYNEENDFVVNIDVSTEKTAQQTFKSIHHKLGLNMKYDDGESKPIQFIMDEVYETLGERSLVVFENADNYAVVKQFLPLKIKYKPTILITSPNVSKREWASRRLKVDILKLDGFTGQEATTFIKNSLNITDNSNDNDIEFLIQKLHNFPLALDQAVAYIKDKSSEKNAIKIILSDYLCKHEENPKTFLDYGINNNMRTLFKTLEITINKIRSDTQYGKQAIDMLNTISYFMNHDIPETLFLAELAENNFEKLIDIINLLRKYAILQLNNGMITIHGLVQEIVRIELKIQIKEEEYLDKALKLLKTKLNNLEDAKVYTPHFVSVWKYAYKYRDLINRYVTENPEKAYTTFFHEIVEGCSYEIVHDIMKEIKSNCSAKLKIITNSKDRDRGISLHNAVLGGNENTVKILIENGTNINAKKKHGWTPLHLAAKNGFFNIAKILLENDADVNAKTGYKFTPLHFAVRNGWKEIFMLLLNHGADVNAKTNSNKTALHFAASENHLEYVEELLKSDDANVNAKTLYGWTPLHFASNRGYLEIVRSLLKQRAEVNVNNQSEFTPLHLAAFYNYLEIVLELLAVENININAQTNHGNTPLHLACERGNVEIVETLIKKNAKVDIANSDGKTAQDMADQSCKNYFLH